MCRGGHQHGVDRGSVRAPQRIRFIDAVTWCGECHRPSIQHLIDQEVHQGTRLLGGRSAVRIWRCASARTCHICQVERLFSITAKM
jgi:hypothetical protein